MRSGKEEGTPTLGGRRGPVETSPYRGRSWVTHKRGLRNPVLGLCAWLGAFLWLHNGFPGAFPRLLGRGRLKLSLTSLLETSRRLTSFLGVWEER